MIAFTAPIYFSICYEKMTLAFYLSFYRRTDCNSFFVKVELPIWPGISQKVQINSVFTTARALEQYCIRNRAVLNNINGATVNRFWKVTNVYGTVLRFRYSFIITNDPLGYITENLQNLNSGSLKNGLHKPLPAHRSLATSTSKVSSCLFSMQLPQ